MKSPHFWVAQLPGVLSLEEVDGGSAKLVDFDSSTYSCEDASSSCDISWPEFRRSRQQMC